MDRLKQMLWLAAAGLCGGFVGLQRKGPDGNKPIRTANEKLAFMASALFVAVWFTPWLCKLCHLTEAEDISAMAFGAGVIWLPLMDKLEEGYKNIKLIFGGKA